MSINIEFIKDETCNDLKIPTYLSFSKEDIFNYGVFHFEIPPDKISDNNFEYIESKIPAYVGMYEDYVEIDEIEQSIKSKTYGESAKNLSEVVGIAVGLKSAIEIFDLDKKEIENIPISDKKEKRLDYKSIYNGNEIHIETKGTTDKYKVKGMIDDIHSKKNGKTHIAHKYGFVTLYDKIGESNGSKIFITDPPTESMPTYFKGIFKYINYYLTYLSFILDNMEYNKVINVLKKNQRIPRNFIKTKKLKYNFSFDNKKYLGQCFDKRLILDLIIRSTNIKKDNESALFNRLTEHNNKNKYFLGIDEKILDNFNLKNLDFFKEYQSNTKYYSKEDYSYIQMEDGILLIISKNGALEEMEEKFPESEVKKRLTLVYDYIRGYAHKCGAPCKTDDIFGKPCENLTYREHCHLHR